MYRCKLCKREFENVTKISAHISHPKSPCKIPAKQYYDQYIRKDGEGICLHCYSETSFHGLAKGYPATYCKYCKNHNPVTKKVKKKNTLQRHELKAIERKKIESSYPIDCKLCFRRFKSIHGLAKHISKAHIDTTTKDYYDKFIKKDGEGICPITGEHTLFKSMVDGYFSFLGKGTNSADKHIKNKKKETLFKNYGVYSPALIDPINRIKKFKKTYQGNRDLKNNRSNLISVLRKLTIDKTDKLQCQICGVKYNSYRSITTHIQSHNITLKKYYDKFFIKDGEGICPETGQNTTFGSLEQGYFKWADGHQQNSKDNKDKQKNTFITNFRKDIIRNQHKYNVYISVNQMEKVIDHVDILCLQCNNTYVHSWYNIQLGYGKCPVCFPRNTHCSKAETELYTYVCDLIGEEKTQHSYTGLIKNPRTGRSFELDIYIPSKKIAIEFNGLYWHSDPQQSDPYYHLAKTQECKKQNVDLIHIFEDEWVIKKDIVKSIIKFKLGIVSQKIFARKCEIKEIIPSVKNEFLNTYHIQGEDKSNVKLGLFSNQNLVAVMTFSKGNISKGGKPDKEGCWELNRYATNRDYHVLGGAGKLLKYFQRNYYWTEIYSYADLRYSNGNLYKALGFTLKHQTPPSYWYTKGIQRFHRFGLRKRPEEPKNITEEILRRNEGYSRIWDCGHLKFELKI